MNQPTSGRLYRLHFWRPDPGGTKPMIWANQVSWAFRQRPIPRHAENGMTGFEVETLRTPTQALAAIEEATGAKWQVTELWSRPAKPSEGEGPDKGNNPWRAGGRLKFD